MRARMFRHVLLLCLLVFATAPLPAQEKPLTLGPALLSFPQIAARLSAPGRVIECAATLRQRAAFVRLQDRDWNAARHLLEAGLDVRLREKPGVPGVWLLEADPQVVEREQTWRNSLAAALHKKMLAQTDSVVPLLRTPYLSFFQRYMKIALELEASKRQDPDHKDPRMQQLNAEMERMSEFAMPTTFVNVAILRNVRLSEVRRALETPGGYALVDAMRYMDVPRVVRTLDAYMEQEEALRQEEARRQEAETGEVQVGNFGDGFYREFRQLLKEVDSGNYSVWQRLRFDPMEATLNAQMQMFVGAESLIGDDKMVTLDDEKSVGAIFEALGPEAKQWRAGERAATETFLKGDKAKRHFPVNRTHLTNALSQAVESWQAAGGGDVIMELVPMREEISLPNDEVSDEETGAYRAPFKESSLKEVATEEHLPTHQTWTFREQDRALLVKNDLAFLNRTCSYPLSAFFALERRWPGQTSVLRLADLRSYQQSVNAAQNATFSGFSIYRGLPIGLIAQSRPFTTLLNPLSPTDRAKLVPASASSSAIDIPLITFGKQSLLEVAQALREIRLASNSGPEEALLPGFADILSRCLLRVENAPDESGALNLHLSLVRPAMGKVSEKTFADLILGDLRN